jgi:intracellular sulfur oxidation DsrE/DsrF family protein
MSIQPVTAAKHSGYCKAIFRQLQAVMPVGGMNIMKNIAAILLATMLAMAPTHEASAATDLDQLLNREQAPAGVVLEIMEADFQALDWAIPQANSAIAQLRARFPGVPLAVVSHGNEQFALMTRAQTRQPTLHDAVRSLVKNDGVPVHVCGTYAARYNAAPEDFPDYINVAAAGPAQIRDYQALGYELIRIVKP